MENKPKTTPRDFFLHAGAIVALYVSAVSFISLLFQLINKIFPDVASYSYYGDPYSAGIRAAIASLIIAFPVYIYLTSLINRDMMMHPESAELGIRKWLTYLTLFAAGVAVAVDLVIVINSFLGGELTTRFLLKILTVFIVSLAIFWYYRFDLRRDKTAPAREIRRAAYLSLAVVIITVVGSFFVIGSPFAARNTRIDERRVSDLSSIQWQVVSYWQQKGSLPVSLGALNDPLSSFIVPQDPVTNDAYGYRVIDSLTFELCATFASPSRESDKTMMYPMGTNNENWQHGHGRVCFTRPIDPDIYKVSDGAKPIPVR